MGARTAAPEEDWRVAALIEEEKGMWKASMPGIGLRRRKKGRTRRRRTGKWTRGRRHGGGLRSGMLVE